MLGRLLKYQTWLVLNSCLWKRPLPLHFGILLVGNTLCDSVGSTPAIRREGIQVPVYA